MIIIKTKNGDHFINEKAVTEVKHDREKATVSCYGGNGYYSHHEDVEGVLYTNDVQPTSWTDEGSEIQRLMKSLEEHKEWSNKLRDEHLNLMQERDQLKQECEELKARVAALTPKEDPNQWWSDEVNVTPINILVGHVQKNDYCGYGVRLGKLFDKNDIKTIGDLLRITRRMFKRYQGVGGGCLSRIDDVLDEMYDIKGW